MYTVKEYLQDLNEMVTEAVEHGDCCNVRITDLTVEQDDLPYGETTVKGPGYVSDMSGEVEFTEPIITSEELEEYFDEDYPQAKKYMDTYKKHTDYSVDVDLKGSYDGDHDIEVPSVNVQYMIDEHGNIVSTLDSIDISY